MIEKLARRTGCSAQSDKNNCKPDNKAKGINKQAVSATRLQLTGYRLTQKKRNIYRYHRQNTGSKKSDHTPNERDNKI